MPFRLTNAPPTFQVLINDVFRPQLKHFFFFEDILVFSKKLEKHLQHMRVVLELLLKNQLYAKMNKYVFGCNEVEYLGHIQN